MSENNQHIILKQIFDLAFPPGADAFSIQQTIGRLAREKLTPQLEALFDRFAGPEELIQIDKLEIDIGHLPIHSLEEDFVRVIIQVLEEKLLTRITYGADETQRSPIRVNRFSQWLFFLEKGYLPWQSANVKQEDLQLAALEQLSTSAAAIAQLQQLIRRHPVVLTRLAMQFPEPFLVQLMAAITARKQEQLPLLLNEIWQLLQTTGIFQKKANRIPTELQFRQSFWEWVFQKALLQQETYSESAALVLSFLEHVFFGKYKIDETAEKLFRQEVLQTLQIRAADFPLIGKIAEAVIKKKRSGQSQKEHVRKVKRTDEKTAEAAEEQGFSKNNGEPKRTMKAETTEHPEERPATENRTADKMEISPNQDKQAADQYHREDQDKKKWEQEGETASSQIDDFDFPEGSSWYVQQAGIVLLHPFLGHYFKHCQLLEKGVFVNKEAQHKAVHLLQYLATGETGLSEYDLVLPKFLCGMPLDELLEREVSLTTEEKTEGEELLKAAIKHWGKLGNATPNGLRQGFLQREGKLEKRQQGWYLAVEQKGTDILLDYLPWNLRMIQLSWMPELLRVEWG